MSTTGIEAEADASDLNHPADFCRRIIREGVFDRLLQDVAKLRTGKLHREDFSIMRNKLSQLSCRDWPGRDSHAVTNTGKKGNIGPSLFPHNVREQRVYRRLLIAFAGFLPREGLGTNEPVPCDPHGFLQCLPMRFQQLPNQPLGAW